MKTLSAYIPVTQEELDDVPYLPRRCFTHTFWTAGCSDCQTDASLEYMILGHLRFRSTSFGLVLLSSWER